MKGEKFASHRSVTHRGRGRGFSTADFEVGGEGSETSDWTVVSRGSVTGGSTSISSFVSYGLFGTPTGDTRMSLSTCDGYLRQ